MSAVRVVRAAQIVAVILLASVAVMDAPWDSPSAQERLFLGCLCAFWLVAAEELR